MTGIFSFTPRNALSFCPRAPQVQLTTLNGAEILSLGQWKACQALREAFSAAEAWSSDVDDVAAAAAAAVAEGTNGADMAYAGARPRRTRCAVIFLDEADALLARCEGGVEHGPFALSQSACACATTPGLDWPLRVCHHVCCGLHVVLRHVGILGDYHDTRLASLPHGGVFCKAYVVSKDRSVLFSLNFAQHWYRATVGCVPTVQRRSFSRSTYYPACCSTSGCSITAQRFLSPDRLFLSPFSCQHDRVCLLCVLYHQ